ncbi:MAG: molybdopterin-dependent oxidoreductase [Desulfobacterales bacterium]
MDRSNQESPTPIDRRHFLKLTGGLSFLIAAQGFLPACRPANGGQTDLHSADISAWVTVHSDDTVTIMNPSSEMGQGSMTALAAIIAEEMDADWSKVRIEHAPAEPEIYGLTLPLLPWK